MLAICKSHLFTDSSHGLAFNYLATTPLGGVGVNCYIKYFFLLCYFVKKIKNATFYSACVSYIQLVYWLASQQHVACTEGAEADGGEQVECFSEAPFVVAWVSGVDVSLGTSKNRRQDVRRLHGCVASTASPMGRRLAGARQTRRPRVTAAAL